MEVSIPPTQLHKRAEPIPLEALIGPPRLPRFLVAMLTPRDLEREVIEDFDAFYRTWVIPEYGSWAPYWAWIQVPKTLTVLIHDTLVAFWGRARKRAR